MQTISNDRWHVHGVRLPDGDRIEEWWVADGIWHDRPVASARTLPGGWFLPGGLVDAHAHLSMNFNGAEHADGSPALIAANLAAQRAVGVLAIRDAGLAWGGAPQPADPQGPQVIWSSRLLSAPGTGYPQICAPVPAEALVEVGLAELRGGASWVKIMGDFPGPDGDWFAAPPVYPEAAVADLVRAVHAAGGRVLAHSTGRAAALLVRAGVDSIEHGMALDEPLLGEMARRGCAWSLTLGTALKHTGALAEQPGPVGDYLRGCLGVVRHNLRRAVALGVPLLVGSDELGHGRLIDELIALHSYGLAPVELLTAASTAARRFLGLPALRAGAPADLVTYGHDPRVSLAALAEPAAIVCSGRGVATA